MIEYRWLTNPEIADLVNEVCERYRWIPLNINEEQPTCRVRGAFKGVALIAFIVLQMTPVLGPAWADSDHRDGSVTRELADQMHEYMIEVKCRGALTICESKVSERLAQRHGMEQIGVPVYQWVGV